MSNKLNLLLKQWPKNTVATQQFLSGLGISRQLANWHVGSGWLERLGPRAFIRPGDEVKWTGAVYAMQTQLNLSVHVGGCSALEAQGLGHFIPLGKNPTVCLVSDKPERLPGWFVNRKWNADVHHHCRSIFRSVDDNDTASMDCGSFQIAVSAPERAMLETIDMFGNNDDADQAFTLMRGLTTLRPAVVQRLLEECRSVKVKRFFLWSAETLKHAWFSHINLTHVDLGKGKRSLYAGGRYNQKYMITTPQPERLPDV